MKNFILRFNELEIAYIIQMLSCISGFLLVYFIPVAYLYIISITAIITTVLFVYRKKKVINFKNKNGD
jgi:ABC-type Mn2+/Zn2+ transport system permease subunit